MLRRVARHLLHGDIMPGSVEGQYIRLEVISGKNLEILTWRTLAGVYISIKRDETRRWKSAVRVLSSDGSVTWGNTVTLLSDALPKLSLELRASFELGRTLSDGELIGKLETSWDELLDHGDEPFDLSFPAVRGIHPSLTLKAGSVHACGNYDGELVDYVVRCEIDRFVKSMTSESVPHPGDALEYVQSVLEHCPVGHPDRAIPLTNLAWACLQGYIRRNIQHIDSTTSLFRDALALRSQGHLDHALSLYQLTKALIRRYSKECTAAIIHESAQLCCKLLPLCPEGTYLRRVGVDGAVDYVIYTRNNLPIEVSDKGIQLRRIVLELCPPGHQHRRRALDELSRSLDTRFSERGCIDDIDESIQLGREAVSLCPEGHPDRHTYLYNLAVSLRYYRFSHQGKSEDLNEAISLYEEGLRLRPVGHKSRDASLDNLGGALVDRFNQHDDINDINRAISLYREALALRPPGHQHHETMLNNLAAVLKIRYGKPDASEDLDEAIDLFRESLRFIRHVYPARHKTLYNLSSALCTRFTTTRKNEDVAEAIRLCHDSLAALPSLHPDICSTYGWLQEAHLSRYRVQRNPVDLSLAMDNFRRASKHPTQGFPARIVNAYNWTVAAEEHIHESALEAYRTFFELLDAHLSTRSSTTSRREAAAAFHYARTLPVDAASCALRRHNLQKAVELVEQGRGQQWALASRLRTSVEDLESANPKLAHAFSELSKRVSNAAQGSATITDRAAADLAATDYMRLTEQWEATVSEIRNIRGFSQFLLPLSYTDLQVAACQGPVIILIASRYSCNAIIVPTSGEPRHVPFPSLALADLEMLKVNFARAIRHASGMGPKEPRTDLIVLLRKIWDEIMLPVVNVLWHDLKVKPRSRIWLCPTAAFTSIPLHAAHPSRTKADRSGRELCLEDIYICSYTPTLSALIRARPMKMRATPSFVAIGQSQPGAGQGEALLTVDSELELVRKLIPATANPITLSGDAATQAGALEALQRNTWVHLACHGKQDRDQPYHSRFAMRDKPLTLLDIMENDAPQAEFAFLSACHTAVGDEETPDEVIHLAAALQFSGFKSVIGTLWVVDDDVAKHVVEAFYENMFEGLKEGVMDCTKAASALNHATYAVKNKVPLEQRIVFIHIGV
ncbi:CHAT domain-containing protein [Suillus ampliporus]|nr:CHAT domain-containing protein [Suillus ampliporus]